VRISGVQVPPRYLRWAILGAGLFLLAVVVTVAANVLGLSGFTASSEDVGTRVTATVSVGAPCDRAGANERVRFSQNGRDREVRFDGCGHAEGEQVDITVPPGAADDVVVHAAQAAVGDAAPTEGLGSLLLLTASTAGAGYAYLLVRGPRGAPLPAPLH
jgi:hypothetical protein